MSLEEDAKELVAIAAAKEILADAEKRVRNRIQIALRRGNIKPCTLDNEGHEIELATISVFRTTTPKITLHDEHAIFPWAIEEFGDGIVEWRLTEQGRASVTAMVKRKYAAAGSPDEYTEIPGVHVGVPKSAQPTLRFAANKDIDFIAVVRAMWGRAEVLPPDLRDGGQAGVNADPVTWESSWQDFEWGKP